jgi:CDP-glucose 4,6-dehydratase
VTNFWRNKTVLVTGHTGFKGGWLSAWLQSLGARVIGFALPPDTTPNFFTLARIAENMESVIGNIQDFSAIHAVVKKYQPEVIFHLAAQPLVRYSYANPIETYATNVMGTVHLLDAVRQTGLACAIVNVTSDKCYENKEWDWGYRENEAFGGYDPYSNSKGCSELVTTAYRNSFFNPWHFEQHHVSLASGRAGNVIGGGDWAMDRLIPDIIQACFDKRKVIIRSPQAIRPWQHVLEPLSGYMHLARKLVENPGQYAEGWNFGPQDSDAKPVLWIVKKILELNGTPNAWQLDDKPSPHEATYLKLDCSKAKNKLHWSPQWSLATTLEKTLHWYKAHQLKMDMREVTLQQINEYTTHLIQEPTLAF